MKESFRDFECAPAPVVWSGIEARLHRRRKIVLFTTFAAAASFLLLFGISGWIFFHNLTNDPAAPALTEQTLHPVIEQKINEDSRPAVPVETTMQSPPKQAIPAKHTLLADNENIVADLTETNSSTFNESAPESLLGKDSFAQAESASSPEDIVEKPEKKEDQEANYSTETLTLYDLTLYDDDYPAGKSKEKSWQLGLGYGTTTGGSVSDPAVSYEANSADFSEDYFSSELSAETKRFEDLENTTHSQPISVGIMANKALSKRWGLESGLLFTRLKTRATTNPDNNSYTEYVSEILYLGIPVTARFSIVSGRRFGLYASQGLVLEKGIKTWYSTNSYSSGVLTDSHTSSYTVEGVQLSSLTSLGADYKFSDLISIYLQPGFQVFFLNETQPYNIRSSSSFWPSIQTGLRFQL